MERKKSKGIKEEEGENFLKIKIKDVGGIKGRGIFANKKLKQGEVIYQEKPIAAYQLSFSKRSSIVCLECFRMVGSPIHQINRILANENKTIDDFSPNLSELLSQKMPQFKEHSKMADLLPCKYGCGEFFCSNECRNKGKTASFHRILCVELSDKQRKSWEKFRRHAMKYHENFVLAARVYAEVICMVKYQNIPLKESIKKFSHFYQKPWVELKNVPKVLTKHSKEMATKEQRLIRMKESFELLKDVLYESIECCEENKNNSLRNKKKKKKNKSEDENENENQNEWSYLFSIDFYSNLLGEFDLVNVNVEYENLLVKIFDFFQKSEGDSSSDCFEDLFLPVYRAMKKIMSCADHEEQMEGNTGAEEMDLSLVFVPVMGIGLFPHVSLTNHSCIPNAEVDYPGNDLHAQVYATRDIDEDEEINLSYIDEHLTLQERQHILKQDYDFICACDRCRVQAAEEILRRRNLLPESRSALLKKLSEATGVHIDLVEQIRLLDEKDNELHSK